MRAEGGVGLIADQEINVIPVHVARMAKGRLVRANRDAGLPDHVGTVEGVGNPWKVSRQCRCGLLGKVSPGYEDQRRTPEGGSEGAEGDCFPRSGGRIYPGAGGAGCDPSQEFVERFQLMIAKFDVWPRGARISQRCLQRLGSCGSTRDLNAAVCRTPPHSGPSLRRVDVTVSLRVPALLIRRGGC